MFEVTPYLRRGLLSVVRLVSAALVSSSGFIASSAFAQSTSNPPPSPTSVSASSTPMTLAQLLLRVEREAPAYQVGLRRIAEVRARRVDAEIAVRNNPIVTVEGGPRVIPNELGPRVSAGITQLFDLGGGSGARTRAVDAAVERESALTEDSLRAVRAAVERSYWRLLWLKERNALAEELEKNASRLLVLAEKRKTAGDATSIEINVARTAVARARSQLRSLAADRAMTMAELIVVLGAAPDEDIDVVGDIRQLPTFDAAGVRAQTPKRADVRAAQYEVAQANAEMDLGDALAIPQLGVGFRYELEEPGVHSFIGTLSLTLPVFDHAQGLSAEAAAKRQRAELEGATLAGAAQAEVVGALKTFSGRVQAARELEAIGASARDENVALTERAFEAGELSLNELLSAQRELASARADYLDSLLEAQLEAARVRETSGLR
jgi:outer membrane protein, heavy metal efflux system